MKAIRKALIGWKKAGPPKGHLCFEHVKRLYVENGFWYKLTSTRLNFFKFNIDYDLACS